MYKIVQLSKGKKKLLPSIKLEKNNQNNSEVCGKRIFESLYYCIFFFSHLDEMES